MDFTSQIRRVKELIDGADEKTKTIERMKDLEPIEERIGLAEKGMAKPSIVPAEDVAFELGPPGMPSMNLVLWTQKDDLVESGKIHILGPDLLETGEKKLPFGQIIMLNCPDEDNLNVFDIETAQFLANRLPGYMVRMVPGRLWARVSMDLMEKGFNLEILGNILVNDYIADFEEVEGAEVVFITSGPDRFEDLKPIEAEAKIISGKNRKLKAVGDGEYECDDLDCESCDEKATCDSIRDIIILRRKEKGVRS